MKTKIALEEHFMVPGIQGYLPDNGFDPVLEQSIEARLPGMGCPARVTAIPHEHRYR